MPGEQEMQKQVFEELRKTHEQLKEYVDRQVSEARETSDGEATAETRQKVDELNAEVARLKEHHDTLTRAVNRPDLPMAGNSDPEAETRMAAFTKYLRYGAGEEGRAQFSEEEYRALSSASDADGGLLVPPDFEATTLREASNAAEVRPQCGVGTTGRDRVILGSLSKPTVAWGTANLAVNPQDMDAGGLTIEIHDLKGLALVHNNTLQDAEADIASEIQMAFRDVIAEAEDDAYIAGSGAQQPLGVIASAAVQDRAVTAGSSLIDSAIQAMYSLKKTYRRNATWAFNSTTEKDIRQLKDDNGQYLWQPPVQAGAPAQFLGRPIINPEGMPDEATNAYFMVVGDFRSGYKVRDRAGLVVQRLTERYAEFDQTAIMVKRRTGGAVALSEAFVPVVGS
ncbi:MAG TPA: phage major capsid protein [Gammaproteobacteria bacterium]|nr:phage major capsid protein [Gammaproteobacteria bacterium]